MNKKRLLKLADLLDADAKNKKGAAFDLNAWAMKKDDDGVFSRWLFQPGESVEVNCNTAACAWGLAAISGAFKREGVGYKVACCGVLSPTFKGKEDFDAAVKFFAISVSAAGFLFEPDQYPRAKRRGAIAERYVAKRIRDFVAGKVSPDAQT